MLPDNVISQKARFHRNGLNSWFKSKSVSCSTDMAPKTKVFWSLTEDMLLLIAVDKHGKNNWGEVAKVFEGTRNARQCRERYKDYLAPPENSTPWTHEEKEVLRRLHDRYRSMSSKVFMQDVKQKLPNRTQADVTNQCRRLITAPQAVEPEVIPVIQSPPRPVSNGAFSALPSSQPSTTTRTTTTAGDELLLADGTNIAQEEQIEINFDSLFNLSLSE